MNTWKTKLLAILPAVVLMAGAAIAPATAAPNYSATDDNLGTVYFFNPKKSGTPWKSKYAQKEYKPECKRVDLIANDNLGYRENEISLSDWGKPYITFAGITKAHVGICDSAWRKNQAAGGGMDYQPTKAGRESFTYTVTAKDGSRHTATITANNVEQLLVRATWTSKGVKFYNPNSFAIRMRVADNTGWQLKEFTLGAKKTRLYKVSATAKQTTHKAGLVYRMAVKGQKGEIPFLHNFYTPDYILKKKNAAITKKATASITRPAAGRATVKLKNTTSKTVTYKVKYKKNSAAKYKTTTKKVKPGKTVTLKLTKLQKKSKVVVKRGGKTLASVRVR